MICGNFTFIYFRIIGREKQKFLPTISQDENFWKHKMRDNFTQYACRVSNKITLYQNYLQICELKGNFPNKFSSQLTRMILARMINSIQYTDDLNLKPFQKYLGFKEHFHATIHFKLTVKISGIDEPLIVRTN